jgi:uncharacterized protein DUF3800
MREPSTDLWSYFVDESGDPVFYNSKGELIVGQEGCSKILVIGYIRTIDPEPIREAIQKVREDVAADKYLAAIPSVQKSLKYFHAKDDCPEVRHMVYKTIQHLRFHSEFIVARKDEKRFKTLHLGKESIFYNDLVSNLFTTRTHVSQASKIYFAVRGNKKRQVPLSDAIQGAKLAFERKYETKVNSIVEVFPQAMTGEPCLQVADYMLWALQRAYINGEMRYFDYIRRNVSFIWDIYDQKEPRKLNRYHSRNQFDIKKISPL